MFSIVTEPIYISTNSAYSFVLQQESTISRFIKEAGLEITTKGIYQPKHKTIFSDFGYYQDEPRQSYFSQIDEKPKPTDNGIRDWKVGDIAIHDIFGRGTVVGIIDGTILQVDFIEHGKKSILATHPKIHKEEKGATA